MCEKYDISESFVMCVSLLVSSPPLAQPNKLEAGRGRYSAREGTRKEK